METEMQRLEPWRRLVKTWLGLLVFVSVLGVALGGRATAAEPKWVSLFDGMTLKGWTGNLDFWRVEDGAITGETTPDHKVNGNTFIIWEGGETKGDFELTADFKLIGGNSGIQYRSFEVPGSKWVVGGYQADMDGADKFTGIIYGEKFHNAILCPRGTKSIIGPDHRVKVVGNLGDSKEILSHIKHEDWNTYHITCRGFHMEQQINGVQTAECDDEDTTMRRSTGIIALQLHAGYVMKVQFKNIKLRVLSEAPATSSSEPAGKAQKKIVFIAGTPSHGYGQHEHRAGCLLLANDLNENVPQVHAIVVENGFPKDPHILDGADCVVVFADGGTHHPLMAHLDEFDALMKKGVGLVCIHYATEVPAGKSGERMAEWTGGYFEPSWSVNPHWTAHYSHLPKHEVTLGVKPFTTNDEWYYHMRFLSGTNDVTPILTDLPPASSLNRPDGPYGGNKYVRAAIANGEPQTMAWARERPDGGRGFGVTGAHFHWNWGNDNFRKLVLNAIVWAAHVPVPATGVPSRTPTLEELEANLDVTKDKKRADFNPERIRAMLKQWHEESGT
jgi:hypothetical protein